MNTHPAEYRSGPTVPDVPSHDHPADRGLEANCPGCGHNVDAVCPDCQRHVEASGASGASLDTICLDTHCDRRCGQASPTGAAGLPTLSRAEFYRRFISLVQGSRNAKFTLGCYLIATGDGFADGVSMTEYARTWGVKKATVSKHCRMVCSFLSIAPSQYMRREETVQKFRSSNRRPIKTS